VGSQDSTVDQFNLSPEREKETEQTLKMMFDLGYVKPEEVRISPPTRSPSSPALTLR
jgi:hypothetical protein